MSVKKRSHGPSNESVYMLVFIIGLLAFLLASGDSKKQKREPIKVNHQDVKVLDGDTIRLQYKNKLVTVRLLQMNAPEIKQCYGKESRRWLVNKIEKSKKLRIRFDSKLESERFDRTLAYLYDGKDNLNISSVASGMAVSYFIDGERGDYAGKIVAAERAAKRKTTGLYRCAN